MTLAEYWFESVQGKVLLPAGDISTYSNCKQGSERL